MDKHTLRSHLDQVAALLALKGETAERVRALQSAVERELLTGRRSDTLDELREQVPPGLVEMLRIPGLGVTKVREIHERLHVESLAELEDAAGDGRLAGLPHFGPRTAEKVLRGIAALRHGSTFRLLHHAIDEAQGIAAALAALDGVRRVEVAGSVRRRCEIIRDLDFVVLAASPSRDGLLRRLGEAPGVIVLASPDDFGLTWVRATGSAQHVAAVEARITGSGPWPDEESVYRAAGLPWIAPELREAMGEIEAAAAGRLPRLVQQRDLRGFLHCHTNYSDGNTTVGDWATACRDAGYDWVGITDHSESSTYGGGLRPADVARQHAEIDAANRQFDGFRILKGVEADILEDGSLDYGPAVLDRFDFVIGSIHTRFGMSESAMTARVLKAMDDPHLTILGHPTGRLLLSRDPYAIDLERVFERAVERGVAVELNADPHRLDLDWRMVRRAKELGVTISLGADAHSIAGMSNMAVGLGVARKGWLEAGDVLNTRDAEAFLGQHA